jgi:hypothetical protein
MADWIRVGNRYINLENICEVRHDERVDKAAVFFIGGGSAELADDDARDLIDAIVRQVTTPPAVHRTVFTPG